jgi:hypothetical protein
MAASSDKCGLLGAAVGQAWHLHARLLLMRILPRATGPVFVPTSKSIYNEPTAIMLCNGLGGCSSASAVVSAVAE